MAVWCDHDTGTNSRNPNRGGGDSPGEGQGSGKAGFCPLPMRWRTGSSPRTRLRSLPELYGRLGLQTYLTCRDAPPRAACVGTRLRHTWAHTPSTPSTILQQGPIFRGHGHTPAPCVTHLWHGHMASTHGHKAVAGTHTLAARGARPHHPWAHACATHTSQASMAHGCSVDAHASATDGHAPTVSTYLGHVCMLLWHTCTYGTGTLMACTHLWHA